MATFDFLSVQIRDLTNGIPEDEKISLPAIRPSLWENLPEETVFEDIKLCDFLRFIADMIE